MIINGQRYWHSRTPTRRGYANPARATRTTTRIGEPSSAMRRYETRINDRLADAHSVTLTPGMLVIWERQPWRVVEIAERPLDLWGERNEQRFAADLDAWERWGRGEKPERATWRHRPIVILLVPATDPKAKPTHLCGPASHAWDVLPEHYAVCVACGELPPCRHEEAEREADERIARAEVLMEIPPGHCLGCGEAITRRQKAVRFPGPNLWRPDLGDGSAVFHARKECGDAAYRYREQWKAAGGQHPQTQLTLDENGEAW